MYVVRRDRYFLKRRGRNIRKGIYVMGVLRQWKVEIMFLVIDYGSPETSVVRELSEGGTGLYENYCWSLEILSESGAYLS